MPPTQIFTFIIGSAVVIFGAYFATYLVARGSQRVTKGRAIQVLDRFSFTKDKSIMLISVYDKIYLVAFAAGSVTLLDNIDPETAAFFAAASAQTGNQPELATLFSRLRSRLFGHKKAGAEAEGHTPFEAYLHAEQEDNTPDRLDLVYSMIQNRKEKEGLRNAAGDNAYPEEDTLNERA